VGDLAVVIAPAFLISEVASVILAFVVVRLVVGPEWRRRLSVRLPSGPHMVLVLLALPALLTLPSVIHELAGRVLPSLGDSRETAEMFGRWPLWFGVLVVGILPGIGEELWCRGFLGRGLLGHYGRFAGVLLTSLFFGCLHVDPAYAIATAAMGLWLHYVYLMSRSLPLSMLLHFTNNSIAVVLANPAYQQGEKQLEAAFNHVVVLVAAGVLLAAVAWALFQSRARLVAVEGLPLWKPAFPGVEAPPPGSGTRVVAPWPSWLAWGLVFGAVGGLAVTIALGFRLGELLP
jgi:membrane protease YdiL (CAAX protease family)